MMTKRWKLDLARIKTNNTALLYQDADQALKDLTGKNYLERAGQEFGSAFVGTYMASVRGIKFLIRLNGINQVDQVDQEGKKVKEGMTGTWEAWHQKRVMIKDFFPETLVPKGSIFNLNDEGELVSVSSIVKLKKIK